MKFAKHLEVRLRIPDRFLGLLIVLQQKQITKPWLRGAAKCVFSISGP